MESDYWMGMNQEVYDEAYENLVLMMKQMTPIAIIETPPLFSFEKLPV